MNLPEGNSSSKATVSGKGGNKDIYTLNEFQKKILIEYVAKEVDRRLNISKWSGITFWGILTAILGTIIFLYDNLDKVVFQENLHGLLFATTFFISISIVICYSVYLFLLSIGKTSYRKAIISQIESIKAKSHTNLLVYLSLVPFPLLFLVLVERWDLLVLKVLAIVLSIGILFKATLLEISLFLHKKGISRFGEEAHDYTISLPPTLDKRLLVFGSFVLIDLILAALAFGFVWSNLWLYDFNELGRIIPSISAFIFAVALIFFFAQMRIDTLVLMKLKELEYEIVSHVYEWQDIAMLLDQKYIGYDVEEWIGIRAQGNAFFKDKYCRLADQLVEEGKLIDFGSDIGKELAAKLLPSLITLKQFEEKETFYYLNESKYHLEKIRASNLLEVFDMVRIDFILQGCEIFKTEVEKKAKEIDELGNRFQEFYKNPQNV